MEDPRTPSLNELAEVVHGRSRPSIAGKAALTVIFLGVVAAVWLLIAGEWKTAAAIGSGSVALGLLIAVWSS